jgi:hypothetical protein
MALSPSQIDQLAVILDGTTQNIYRVAESRFGEEATDGTFEELGGRGLRHCDLCGLWFRCDEPADFCEGCEGK